MPDRTGGMDEISSVLLQNIQEVEQKDERQVLAELAGETLQEYIYETEVTEWVLGKDNRKHKEKVRKVKLSWVGTREVARSRGNIVLSEPEITDVGDNLRVVVKATDLLRNFTVYGGCQVPKKMKVNDWDNTTGEIVSSHLEDDPFIFQKGLSKAQRNALSSCIPADYASRMIDRFLRQGGKQPLLKQSKALTQQPAKKSDIKPRSEWDKIAREQVKDYPTLQRILWDLAKIQPAEMYQELGGGSINDMTIPVWQAFVTLKEHYVPLDQTTG